MVIGIVGLMEAGSSGALGPITLLAPDLRIIPAPIKAK
jgi:hypothetical protein